MGAQAAIRSAPQETDEELEARLPGMGMPPHFDVNANGTPAHWNSVKPLIWGKKTKNRPFFYNTMKSSLDESLERVKEFLNIRNGPDNRPMSEKLTFSTGDGLGWYRFGWEPFGAAGGVETLPKRSTGGLALGPADWQRAW